MTQVSKIIFPNKPHLDPIAAYWLLRQYGADRYVGIDQAKFGVWTSGQAPDSTMLENWQQTGVVTFDIAGGTFDHHGNNDCLTVMVAKQLNVIENPELQSLLRYVQEDDASGLHNNFGELAGILKVLYQANETIESVIILTLKILDALQTKEKAWHVEAKVEFDTKAKVFKIKQRGRKIKLVVIKSDNFHVANYAKQNEGVAIVVQQNKLNQCFIFTNAFFRIHLEPLVAVIRWREAELNHKTVPLLQLRQPGKIQAVQNWFYHESLNALMNGSEALANTIPTKITLQEIVELVVFGLSDPEPEIDPQAQAQYDHYAALFKQVSGGPRSSTRPDVVVTRT